MANTIKYKLAPFLGNIRHDSNYKNALKFDGNKSAFNFYTSLDKTLLSRIENAPYCYNFNLGDTINTSAILDVNDYGLDVNEAVKLTFLVAEEIVEESLKDKFYYFYFIKDAQIMNMNTIKYTLELDVFSTYPINSAFEMKDAFVDRRHCDRFTSDSFFNDRKFNFEDSLISGPEDIEGTFNAKYPSNVARCDLERDLFGSISSTSYLDNPGFAIFFLSGTDEDKAVSKIDGISFPYDTIIAPFFPVYMGQWTSDAGSVENRIWSFDTTYEALKLWDKRIFSRILNIVVIKTIPLEQSEHGLRPFKELEHFVKGVDYEFNSEYLSDFSIKPIEIKNVEYDIDNSFFTETKKAASLVYLRNVTKNTLNRNNVNKIDLGVKTAFNNSISKGDLKDMINEPKLLKRPFTNISIGFKNNEKFSFDFFDLKKGTIDPKDIIMKTSFSPEGTKNFVTIKGKFSENEEERSYLYNTLDNNVGTIISDNTTLPLDTSNYAEFIARNKNAKLTSIYLPVVEGAISGAQKGGPQGALVGGASSLITNSVNYMANVDNIKNSPNSVKNATNDYIFDRLTDDKGLYVFKEELRLDDKIKAYNYFYRFGYEIQRFEDSSKWFTRYLFNYVKTNEEDTNKIVVLKKYMGQKVKDRIITALNNGVTFWNPEEKDKLYDESYENYEKRLLEV